MHTLIRTSTCPRCAALTRPTATATSSAPARPSRPSPKVRPQFLLGDYELAAFVAMREGEIAIREQGGLGVEPWPALCQRQLTKPARRCGLV